MRRRWLRTCLVGAVCALTLSFSAPQVRAQIAPLPPGQPAYGLTQGQWLEAFAQWFGSIPVSSNPRLNYDSDGTHAGVGQHGPVWFLSDQPRGTQYARTVTVPEGKAILTASPFLMVTAATGARTDASLVSQVDANMSDNLGGFTRLDVSLDEVLVGNIMSYRVHTD